MTEKDLEFLKVWFKRSVDAFRNKNGVLHPMLELKLSHSLRVAENARLIAVSLGIPTEDQYIAEGVGLLHDVGRFTQFARYGSFRDSDTVDHGYEGYRILELQNPPLLRDSQEWRLLLFAVLHHNKKRMDIPDISAHKQERLLRLVRDADKIDIMELVLNSVSANGFQDLPLMLPHIRLSRDLSPEVLEEAENRQTVSTGNLSTLADFLIMIATWFHDLNYLPALQMAVQRNILFRIEQELPKTRKVENILRNIHNLVLTRNGGEGKIHTSGSG